MTPHDLWILLTAVLVAASLGFVGCFLILRRLAMVGDAISHSVLLGIVVAFLLTGSTGLLPMVLGAGAAGLLSTWMVELLRRAGVQEDAATGISFTAFFGLGVVLLTLHAGDVHLDTQHVLFGDLVYVPFDILAWRGWELGPRAVWTVGGALLIAGLTTWLFFKEFKVIAFDPAFAAVVGLPVAWITWLQTGLVTLVTVAAFESVGAILAVAMLVAPGATAFLLTDRLESMLGLSVLVGVPAAVAGYGLASWSDLSIAGATATMAGLLFALALLLAPHQGLLARWRARRRTPA